MGEDGARYAVLPIWRMGGDDFVAAGSNGLKSLPQRRTKHMGRVSVRYRIACFDTLVLLRTSVGHTQLMRQ